MTDNAYYTDDDGIPFSRAPLEITGKSIPTLSSGDKTLENIARNHARNDTKSLEELSEEGFIYVIPERLERRIQKIAEQHVDVSLDPDEYERQVNLFQERYQNRLHEMIENNRRIQYINNPQFTHLRQMAIQDREEAPSRSYRDWHIRDLAVIRAMQELSISLDRAKDNLAEMHPFVDAYQTFYSSQREEVEWPPKGSF